MYVLVVMYLTFENLMQVSRKELLQDQMTFKVLVNDLHFELPYIKYVDDTTV
jgi:hypothetical protein